MLIEILTEFFGGDLELLAELEKACKQRVYQAGSMIVAEGDAGDSVLYILEGEARALRYSIAGAEVFIDNFEPGDLIGEMAVLGNGVRTADIYALTDVTLAVFPGTTFTKLMEKYGTIGLQVSRLLAARIQQTTRRMFEQSTLSSKGRVYAELMRLAKPLGDTEMSKITDMPPISDIAKKLGIARETVSRTVNELKDEAILEKTGSDILIMHPNLLVSRLG